MSGHDLEDFAMDHMVIGFVAFFAFVFGLMFIGKTFGM